MKTLKKIRVLFVHMILVAVAVPYTGAMNINCGVEIIEINYDDDISDNGYEWVKLQNRTGKPLNISSWRVGDDDNANMTISQVVGWGDITNIPDGATFVICETSSSGNDFAVRYGAFKSLSNYLARASGDWGFSKSGERIRISSTTETGENFDIQRFTFYGYTTSFGENKSIVKRTFFADETLASSWRPGAPGGTPFALSDVSRESFKLKISVDNNPFDPTNYESGIINFETENNALKTIYIFNIQGQEITRLIDANISKYGEVLDGIGKGSIRWDGRDKNSTRVPSGIYIVCLEASDGKVKRRVTNTIAVGRQF